MSYIHPKLLCEQKDCEEKRCPNRHLKHCKNWQKATCKFGNNCQYKHDQNMKKAIDNIEPEIVVREVDINVNDSNRSESAMDININIEDIFKDFDETHDQNSENNLENKTKDLIEENLS